ncbi:helix-turn-helix domain-containing protein [Acidomonas methanolica]|uniref:Sugar fermentation stimulation protein B n=1 Tax=Acidomonas methanolica NBRC 104435 TaxID=1231351 RepID=A0A023D7W2_ACIMT|nr:helix-turn-helix domain-containing protein [Acidomonas methanolica]MBU2653455.1 helix-turn-helix domain-containing protein [Acidomonas methanolica]TCS32408.1 Nlp family transcriptional regulator [Acidomonas methanolica]GAJ30218.1 sugar fermentation stimulation protein B [Acidomonas methanolica NBRC 104435]GBQ52858.1 putative transcriptional regulator [Acidomonas methanolica]GEK97844.1 hypothetical protein AME01nite_03430 [Acidomonas methanolica NBRC 104435]
MAQKPREMHPGMHVEDIRAVLRKKWGTLRALSIHLGRNPNAVTQTLSTPGYSVPVELAIAEELGMSPHEVWPARFHPDGTPVSLRVDRTPTAAIAVDHRRKEVAA